MLEILVWIVFGALAGWIASMIMNTNEEQGAISNIIIGIIGAILGGYGARALGESGVTGFNFRSLIIAVIGAVVLIAILKLFNRSSRSH